ncbi:MAG TPA: GNAT family N-acetyltransferase [Rhodospirillales bacterium]
MEADFQIQPFETGVLGVPVGRLRLADAAGRLPAGLGRLISGWRRDGVWMVSCRVDKGAPAIGGLEKNGFKAIETLVTLRRDLGDKPAAQVDDATPADHDAIVAIARRAFTMDRLHRDGRVPADAADAVRERWIRNDLEGRANASLIVREGSAVAGFILCLLDGGEAVIDLIAVDVARQKKGIGRALVAGAVAHYAGRARAMRVGTQADNEASLKMYRAVGFAEATRQVTLHWINPEAAPVAP